MPRDPIGHRELDHVTHEQLTVARHRDLVQVTATDEVYRKTTVIISAKRAPQFDHQK